MAYDIYDTNMPNYPLSFDPSRYTPTPTNVPAPAVPPVRPASLRPQGDASVPMPPARPPNFGINVPVGQTASAPQPGGANFWDALRNLFSGQRPAPSAQGMTGLLQPRGQAGAGTNALGNPFNRFG